MDTDMPNIYSLWAGILFAVAIMTIVGVIFGYAVANMCSSPICGDGQEEENIHPTRNFRNEIERSGEEPFGNLNRDAFLRLSNAGRQHHDCNQMEV